MKRVLDHPNSRTSLDVRIGATSNRIQRILSFVVFTLTAAILAGPLEGPIVRRPIISTQICGGVFVPLSISLAESAICLTVLILMWRLASSLSDDARPIFTRDLLLAFLLFFSLDRAAAAAIQLLHLHRLAHLQPWIEVLTSLSIAIGSTLLLPRKRCIASL